MTTFSAYHGVTGAEHQHRFNALSAQGYRPVSLSLYGDPNDARYAAVWVQRPGPAWEAVHGVDAAGYQAFFNTWMARGYAPVIVSAAGTGPAARFAAVFEQGAHARGWFARHGLRSGADTDPNTFQYQCRFAQENGYLLTAAAIYGDQANRLYAGVWARTPNPVQWLYHAADSAASYQTWFDAATQLPFRPAFVALSTDQTYLSVFRDDSVGEWVARHGLSGADYQAAFNQLTAQGYYPIAVQGGGAGGATRYAAIFARRDIPFERLWTVTGQAVPALAAFDAAMQQHMQREGIRAGTLAIAKDGVLKLARAYTWAEPGYSTTQPSSLFRLASVSKMFTSAAIQTLYDAGTVHPTDRVFPLLGITTPAVPGQTPDPRTDTITVQHLVDHLGGWIRNHTSDPAISPAPFDPVFAMRGIARRLNLPGPLTKRDLAGYMYGRPLDFDPGVSQPAGVDTYSNFGYVLLGLVIEKVTGQPYVEFVRQHVLTPLGVADVSLSHTLRTQRAPDEVSYDDPGLGASAAAPHSDALVPFAYGGEGWLTEVMDSGGGMMATATALTHVAHRYAVWGIGGRGPATRIGSMAGTGSLVCSRGQDGVDYAFIFNTRHDAPGVADDLNQKLDALLNTVPIP